MAGRAVGLLEDRSVSEEDPWLELVELQSRQHASRRIGRMSLFAWMPLLLLLIGAIVGVTTIVLASR